MSAQPLVEAWLDGKPRSVRAQKLPTRPMQPKTAPLDSSWQLRAACRDVSAEISAQFTDAVTQEEAAIVAKDWCAGCPVALDCLQAGRETWAWGLHGGVVLINGMAAPRTAAELRPRLKVVPTTPAAPPRGQRWQPRHVSRARRRRMSRHARAERNSI